MNTNTATQPDPAAPPPAAATSPAPSTAEAAPRRRYKNPNRNHTRKPASERKGSREVRAALRSLFVNRRALSPEEAATLARLRTECDNFEGAARECDRRAASGGFVTPTGARLSPDECRARAAAYRNRAEDAARRVRELCEAVNARAVVAAAATGDAQAADRALFFPTRRHGRNRVAARPVAKPRP